MKVALYARVSSEKQDVDLSISAQLKALREYAGRNGYEIIKEFVDQAESGKTTARPAFREMIGFARVKQSPFEIILVWKLSRFARNREDSIIYKSLLRKHGIQVISINEPVDHTPSGRLLEGVIEVIDEFYSANLSQDVVRGMRECVVRGFYPGGCVPYGYKIIKVKDGETVRSKLDSDPSTAPLIQRIFRECVEGKGLKEIAKGLNRDGLTTRAGRDWGTTSLHHILRNRACTGVLAWDRRKRRNIGDGLTPLRIEDAWPAIIDQNTFDQAQTKLASRAPRVTHPRVVHSEYILSGMIRCKQCGTSLIGHAVKSGKFFYYMCGNARRKGRDVCNTPLLPKDRIERFFIDRIKQYILTEENLEELVELTNEELTHNYDREKESLGLLAAQISEVDSRLGKLYDALETGEFKGGEISPRIKVLFLKKEDLLGARALAEEALRCQTAELVNPGIVKGYVEDLKQLLDQSELVEKRSFLKSFIESIEVEESTVKVIYTIPMPPSNLATETVGVLPFIRDGRAYGIRTRGLILERDVS